MPRALLLVVLVSLLVAAWIGRPARFNRAVWYANAEPESLNAPRFRMTNDLIKNQIKIEMPRSQSRALLGAPDASSQITFDTHGQVIVNDTDAYSLGFVGDAKDISTLELHFDAAGRLTSVKVARR